MSQEGLCLALRRRLSVRIVAFPPVQVLEVDPLDRWHGPDPVGSPAARPSSTREAKVRDIDAPPGFLVFRRQFAFEAVDDVLADLHVRAQRAGEGQEEWASRRSEGS